MVFTVTAAQPISEPRSPCRPRVFGAKSSPAPVLPAAPQSAAASCSPNSRSPCCSASNSNRLQPGATGTPGTNRVDLAGGSLARVKSPSGHLTTRSLGMSLEERASVCTFDCPDTCSITVTIDDGRVAKVRGSHALPYTAGVICTKVARDMEAFVHGPQRLLHPMRRTGSKGSGQFERISWEAALDEIHKRVDEVIGRWGPQAVLPLNYAGPHGLLAGDSMSLRFFHRLGASQLYRRALCGGVRSEAWVGTYGAAPGCPPELAEHARLNIVWGNNATVSNVHLVRCIRRAKRRGCRLAVVDPLRSKIAEQADLHLQILPGTDTLLAWAVAAELEQSGALDQAFIAAHVLGFEEFMTRARQWPAARAAAECGVPAEQIL